MSNADESVAIRSRAAMPLFLSLFFCFRRVHGGAETWLRGGDRSLYRRDTRWLGGLGGWLKIRHVSGTCIALCNDWLVGDFSRRAIGTRACARLQDPARISWTLSSWAGHASGRKGRPGLGTLVYPFSLFSSSRRIGGRVTVGLK